MSKERECHVLFVCRELHVGGAESQWQILLPELQARDIRPRLIATSGGGHALREIQAAGVSVTELGVGSSTRRRDVPLSSVRRFPRLLAEPRPTVVVSWGYTGHLVAAWYARLKLVPHVITYHRAPGYRDTREREAALHLAGLLGAGAIAATTSQLEDLRHFHVRESRVRIARYGVRRPSLEASPAERTRQRRKLGLDEDAFVPVLVARLRREKRVTDFLEAVAAVARCRSQTKGIVVGDGPLEMDLRRRAQELNAPVEFAGFQSDPIPYMVASDVVCLTSELEATPVTLMEAAACGVPVVATDVGGTREIVGDGVSGLVVPMGDVGAIAQALALLANSSEQRAALGVAARNIWETRYTVSKMADRYVQLLTGVTGPPTTWLTD